MNSITNRDDAKESGVQQLFELQGIRTEALKVSTKSRRARLLLVATALLLVAGCNIIAVFNGNGKITFHSGVHDAKNWSTVLTKVSGKLFFLGGWGVKGPAGDMEKYNFSLTSPWFSVRHATLADGFKKYTDIWNYIDAGVNNSGVHSSVVHTHCVLNYNYAKVAMSNTTNNDKYKCRIIVESTPLAGGVAKRRIWITIRTKPWNNNDLAQLNIYMEGNEPKGPVSIVYL